MKALNKKLLGIQSNLKAPKDLFNKFGSYKYRSCESILEQTKPHLIENGCTLLLTDELVLIGERYYIKATATLVDTDSGESISVTAYAREEETKKGMDSSQITGSSSSYARKYALNGLLLIDDTKDADATNEHKDDLPEKLENELKKYDDPIKLEKEKITLRDKFVKLGMNKKEATEIIQGCLNDF